MINQSYYHTQCMSRHQNELMDESARSLRRLFQTPKKRCVLLSLDLILLIISFSFWPYTVFIKTRI